MHGLNQAHAGPGEPQHAKHQAQSLQQDREDRQRGCRQVGGRVQSVRGGEPAQPTTEQSTPRCPVPYLPCRTSDHQEAGGVLERVESRRQGAVGTEPVLQEKKCWKGPPRRGVRFGKSVAEVVSKRPNGPKRQMKITPQDWPVPGAQRRERESKGRKSPQTGPPQKGTCPLQAGAGSVPGDVLGRFPGMAGTVSPRGKGSGPQQWTTAIRKPHQPGTRRLCPAQTSQPMPQDPRGTEEWGWGLIFQGQHQRVEVPVLAPPHTSGQH